MTAFLSRLLGCLPLLWFAFGLGVLSSSTRGYDAPTHTRLTYDGAFVSAFDYDSASIPSTNEWENRTVGMGGAFVDLAKFLAADTALPQFIYRTGSQTEHALTDAAGVSFRDSISSDATGAQVFQPGAKIYAVDTSKLPPWLGHI